MIFNIATLSQDLTAPKQEFRILPPGVFRAWDGRPAGLPGWKMDASIARQIVADLAARDDLVIDYEHQTLRTKDNGQPAPAAGWCNRLVWREGQGLFVSDVKWTDKAKAMLSSGEYRFISPVFTYNAVTGHIERLLSLGLTNNPALTRLTDMSQVAANSSQLRNTPRESDRGIEAFNRAFGEAGIFHPDTPPGQLAELTGNLPKPRLDATMTADDKEKMRRAFPGVFVPD